MRIIFSRDRPAQLDLLLRSIERHMEPEDTRILWIASNDFYRRGFDLLGVDTPPHGEEGFFEAFKELLGEAPATVTLFCDDDIVYRPVQGDPPALLLSDDRILTVCLYLGRGNVKQAIPDGFPVWEWHPLDRHDFGFPCAVDGNTYRPDDVLALMGGDYIPNPTWVEAIMAMRIRMFQETRPLMASFTDQSVVSVPVNRTSHSLGPRAGRRFPQEPDYLNNRFLGGERIDFDALDFAGIDSCHHEIRYEWMKP